MKYTMLTINGMAVEVDQSSYEAFDRDKDNDKMIFHNFRDKSGVVHTVAKSVILSVAMESGLAVKMVL